MILTLLFVFLAGMSTRLSDMVADGELRARKFYGYALGISYGTLTALVVALNPILGDVAIAVILSVLLTGKIDNRIHYLGIGAFAAFIALSGINPIGNVPILLAFIAAGVIDEIGNDYSDRRKKNDVIGIFFQKRMVMELTSFLVTLVTGEIVFFISLIIFEIGYSYIFMTPPGKKLLRLTKQ